MVTSAREFLSKLDLTELSAIDADQFGSWLDMKTQNLMNNFPLGAQTNWGAARKAMNVFLENVFYDRFLAKQYNLEALENILELPLVSCLIYKLNK